MSSLLETLGGGLSTSASLPALGLQGRKLRGFGFSGDGAGLAGGGGAGRFMLGLPWHWAGLTSLVEGAVLVVGEEVAVEESGERHTGRSSQGSVDTDWRTGAEMSRVLRLLRSDRPFLGKDPVLLLLELFSLTDGVRLTFEISFDKVDLSPESVESFPPPFSSMWHTWTSCTWAWGCVDQVGVITFPRGSSVEGWGWWMMGGVLGLVGEGRMIWSLNTALLALSLGGLKGSASFSVLVARMEDWETPVEGAFAIRDAALGVAVWSTGLLIRGRTVAVGGGRALEGSLRRALGTFRGAQFLRREVSGLGGGT